jgi:HK97 gp10 family phage protein
MKIKAEIVGLPELLRTMEQLPRATNRSALQKVLKKAGEPILSSIQQKAPRDSGYLSQSFAISTKLNPSNRRDVAREGKDFAEVYVGTRRGSAAQKIEYGTVHMTAKPFIRPSWDSGKGPALETIKKGLWTEISKAAARYAKRQAKLRG